MHFLEKNEIKNYLHQSRFQYSGMKNSAQLAMTLTGFDETA